MPLVDEEELDHLGHALRAEQRVDAHPHRLRGGQPRNPLHDVGAQGAQPHDGDGGRQRRHRRPFGIVLGAVARELRLVFGGHLAQAFEKDRVMPREVRDMLVRRPRARRRPARESFWCRAGEDRVERVELGLEPQKGRPFQGVTPPGVRRAGAAGDACTAAGTISVRLKGASDVLSAPAFTITAFRSAIAFADCAFTSV